MIRLMIRLMIKIRIEKWTIKTLNGKPTIVKTVAKSPTDLSRRYVLL